MNKNVIIFFALIIYFTSNFAQDDRAGNPAVELPEFVITGSDAVNVMKAKKIEPDLIPVINQQFLKPEQPTEDLPVSELSDPFREEFKLLDSLNYFTGKLEAGAGIYELPKINISLSSPFSNGIFQVTAKGKNRRAYVENSERYDFSTGLDVFYQLESESPIFNGTKFQFHGDYGRTAYKLFAANDPFIKRNLNKGNISLRIENLLEDKFNYALSFSDDIHSLQDNIYSENFLKFGGMIRANLSSINFGVNTWYNVQMLKNELVLKNTSDLFSIRPFIGFNFSDYFKTSIGVNYNNFKDQSKFYPYLFSGFRFNDQISAYLEYSPHAEMLSNGYFLDMNPYFSINDFINLVHEKKNMFQLAAKYEYGKYYEINAGVKYFSSDASPFFYSSPSIGRFSVGSIASKSYTGFVNLLFHLGPYGYLYSSVELNETKSDNGNILPYHPAINSLITYGYNFDSKLESRLTLSYLSKQYADIPNTISLNPFIDLKLDFTYKISHEFNLTFELNNLLNKNNYKWIRYKEPPLDLVAGLIFRW